MLKAQSEYKTTAAQEFDVSTGRPVEAFLICRDDLTVVYTSRGLEPLLHVDRSAVGGDQDVTSLLRASAVFDATTQLTIGSRLQQAKIAEADCSFDVFSATRSSDPISIQIQRVGDSHWIVSFDNLGARQEAQDRVAKLTLTDSLTGLGNRVRFQQSLTLALSAQTPGPQSVALLMIDLDRFKAVNDTLGHPVGDRLLRKVADRLRTVIRQTDMLARLGGDEFAVWLPAPVESDVLSRLGARIVDLLGRPFLIDGLQINIGASIGIAVAPQDGGEYEALMKCADLALYSAKEAGRNIFHFFDQQMERRAQDRRRLELDLRRALPLRQFELMFKPQIDVETQRLIGLEAMLRWRHPERGVLEPESFMPLAEEIGLVAQIGNWVLEATCREAVAWVNPVRLVVGVLTQQFEAASLVDAVRRALSASGLPPDRLELEITEGVLLRNELNVVKTLYELKSIGVRIGISNFGTGYASLTRLDSFPFDRIKMDISLVREDSSSNRAIVSAVVAFGASLGVNTMVDGISTGEQLEKLRSGGATSVRGFLSATPLPPPELAGLLQSVDHSRT